jgi:hypothetical protein
MIHLSGHEAEPADPLAVVHSEGTGVANAIVMFLNFGHSAWAPQFC